MNLEIVLVRHGQSVGNRDRVFVGHGPGGLTDLGHRQAEAAAAALAAMSRPSRPGSSEGTARQPAPIEAIYVSDLPRAVETAAPLARLTGMTPIVDAALRERDVGAYTGLTFEDVMARDPSGWERLLGRDPDHRPDAGESHRDCRLRVAAFFDAVQRRHGSDPAHPDASRPNAQLASTSRIVLVSHGVAINHMLRHALELPVESRSLFVIDNCSLSRLQHRPEGAVHVLTINDRSHLLGVAANP